MTMTFKKTLLAASLAALSMAAVAQVTGDAAQDSADAPASTDWALTANVNLASSYRFRGIDQTFNQPAIQGGVDLTMPYGFYVGNWNSNVNGTAAGYYGGNIEMDLYGGWKYAFTEDVGLDTGLINYFYPGSNNFNNPGATTVATPGTYNSKPGMVYNLEYYIGANWKTVSLKQFFALTDYFNVQGNNGASTSGSGYTDLRATYDLSDLHPVLGGFGLLGHAGYFYMNNFSQANYADWELGVTKDFGNGWNAKVSYIQADTSNSTCGKNASFYCFSKNGNTASGQSPAPALENAGHGTAMVTIGRTF
jgi:uncharacterized protein (TIGR02001 family)